MLGRDIGASLRLGSRDRRGKKERRTPKTNQRSWRPIRGVISLSDPSINRRLVMFHKCTIFLRTTEGKSATSNTASDDLTISSVRVGFQLSDGLTHRLWRDMDHSSDTLL